MPMHGERFPEGTVGFKGPMNRIRHIWRLWWFSAMARPDRQERPAGMHEMIRFWPPAPQKIGVEQVCCPKTRWHLGLPAHVASLGERGDLAYRPREGA
jgi:hypothetical protein